MKRVAWIFDENNARVEKDPEKIKQLEGQPNVLINPNHPLGVPPHHWKLEDGKITVHDETEIKRREEFLHGYRIQEAVRSHYSSKPAVLEHKPTKHSHFSDMLVAAVTALAVSLLVLFCARAKAEEPKVRISVPTSLPNVVAIQADDNGCTGWIAAKNTYVSAAHCFEGKPRWILATFEDGKVARLKLLYKGTTPAQDFAILSGNTFGITPIPFSQSAFQLPTPCVFIGYGPLRRQDAMPCLGSKLELQNPVLFGLVAIFGEVDHGDSGGPVLVKPFAVVGIAVRMFEHNLPGGYIVSAAYIQAKLHELHRDTNSVR